MKEMRKLGGILGVIIGAVLVLGACKKPTPAMDFQRLDPNFGGLQGGKTIRIVGDSIRLDIGYAVYFGELRSPQVSIQNDKALLAVTPRQWTPGMVDVRIRADNGSAFVIHKGFEYINQRGQLLEAPPGPQEPEEPEEPEEPQSP
jgi:hypothetical protein